MNEEIKILNVNDWSVSVDGEPIEVLEAAQISDNIITVTLKEPIYKDTITVSGSIKDSHKPTLFERLLIQSDKNFVRDAAKSGKQFNITLKGRPYIAIAKHGKTCLGDRQLNMMVYMKSVDELYGIPLMRINLWMPDSVFINYGMYHAYKNLKLEILDKPLSRLGKILKALNL